MRGATVKSWRAFWSRAPLPAHLQLSPALQTQNLNFIVHFFNVEFSEWTLAVAVLKKGQMKSFLAVLLFDKCCWVNMLKKIRPCYLSVIPPAGYTNLQKLSSNTVIIHSWNCQKFATNVSNMMFWIVNCYGFEGFKNSLTMQIHFSETTSHLHVKVKR